MHKSFENCALGVSCDTSPNKTPEIRVTNSGKQIMIWSTGGDLNITVNNHDGTMEEADRVLVESGYVLTMTICDTKIYEYTGM